MPDPHPAAVAEGRQRSDHETAPQSCPAALLGHRRDSSRTSTGSRSTRCSCPAWSRQPSSPCWRGSTRTVQGTAARPGVSPTPTDGITDRHRRSRCARDDRVAGLGWPDGSVQRRGRDVEVLTATTSLDGSGDGGGVVWILNQGRVGGTVDDPVHAVRRQRRHLVLLCHPPWSAAAAGGQHDQGLGAEVAELTGLAGRPRRRGVLVDRAARLARGGGDGARSLAGRGRKGRMV